MAFKVCRSVSHKGICRGVRLVERIGAEALHIIKNFVCRLLVHSVCNRACAQNIAVFILFAVNKELPLPLHNIMLFLCHCAAHNVRPAEGIARKRAEDLHYLLLVHNAPVGDREYRL